MLASGLVRVNFSPDGRNVAATNDGGTVSIWDVDSRRLVGRPLAGHRREHEVAPDLGRDPVLFGLSYDYVGRQLRAAPGEGRAR